DNPTHTSMVDPSARHPALTAALRSRAPLLWTNPSYDPGMCAIEPGLDPEQARARLQRCAGLVADVFPELQATQGRLASPLTVAPALRQAMERAAGQSLVGVPNGLPCAPRELGT